VKTGGGIKKLIGSVLRMPGKAVESVKKTSAQFNTETSNDLLASMITNAIIKGLGQSIKSQKKIESDKENIRNMTIENGIDLNRGGGLLLFGPNLQINNMVHMFFNGSTPVYFKQDIDPSNSSGDLIQAGLQGKFTILEPNLIAEAVIAMYTNMS
jgi:hypothetical protein